MPRIVNEETPNVNEKFRELYASIPDSAKILFRGMVLFRCFPRLDKNKRKYRWDNWLQGKSVISHAEQQLIYEVVKLFRVPGAPTIFFERQFADIFPDKTNINGNTKQSDSATPEPEEYDTERSV